MDTHRIDVFHVAYRDDIARAIAHHFIFDLFPACDRTFHQNLSDSGQAQAVCQDLIQFLLVRSDSAAGSAQCVSRTQNHRISDAPGKCFSVLNILNDPGRCDRLMDLLHGFLELKAVFRPPDGAGSCPDQPDVMVPEETSLLQFHRQVQSCLSSEGRQNTVRLLLLYDLLHHFHGQRFDVDMVRDIFIRHDRRRVGVEKNDFHSFLTQAPAGLCACIVKLGSLADDDRAGSDYKNFFNVWMFRHGIPFSSAFTPHQLFIIIRKRSNRYPESWGPGQASG